MKKQLAIFLLFCLWVPVLGTSIWLLYQKHQVRIELAQMMKTGFKQEQRTRFAFTKTEMDSLLRWEYSREFEYKQKMYDVLAMQTIGELTIIWCWSDEKETRVNNQLQSLLEQTLCADPQRNKTQEKLFQFIQNLYYFDQNEWKWIKNPVVTESIQRGLPAYQSLFSSFFQDPSSPPPELV